MPTGVYIMAGELDEFSAAIGALQAEIKSLSRTVHYNQETSTTEHRKVHDIVVATSEAVRNLTRIVHEMKPLTDDYREKRAERRGQRNLITAIYVMLGGIIGATASRLMEFFTFKPHP